MKNSHEEQISKSVVENRILNNKSILQLVEGITLDDSEHPYVNMVNS